MECKKCGKAIEEYELYCDDCKELLKKEKELDKLIIENKELNKLEITKEIETLQNFKDDNKEDSLSLKEELDLTQHFRGLHRWLTTKESACQ